MILKNLRAVFTRTSHHEHDATDELQFHLEKEIEKNIGAGMSREEARRQALIAFGGVQQTRESLREVHRGLFFEAIAQDARYAWRAGYWARRPYARAYWVAPRYSRGA